MLANSAIYDIGSLWEMWYVIMFCPLSSRMMKKQRDERKAENIYNESCFYRVSLLPCSLLKSGRRESPMVDNSLWVTNWLINLIITIIRSLMRCVIYFSTKMSHRRLKLVFSKLINVIRYEKIWMIFQIILSFFGKQFHK